MKHLLKKGEDIIRNDIKENSRIQIELEHEIPIYRTIRGIVISVTENEVFVLTDFGEQVQISKDAILAHSSTSFSKVVSEVLQRMRNHYETMFQLQKEYEEYEKALPELQDDLHDAQFLSKFNLPGVKARLEHSISPELLNFKAKDLEFNVYFQTVEGGQFEAYIAVKRIVDYPQFDIERDMEKFKRYQSPDVLEWLERCFKARKIEEKERMVFHVSETFYAAKTLYRLQFDITAENFIDFRMRFIDALEQLKK
ncbi:hypothetical protein ACOMCU_00150 [Lysinibacillus sp. UGB7]